jgi:hypothetical protein
MNPELKKLLEIAGTLDKHVSDETKLFKEVCAALTKLETFSAKQRENKVYGPLASCAKELCNKLNKHLDRYK